MKLFKPIKRWWRSKGFGIHSPFAFYFILRVLREKLPYYAYTRILKFNSTEVLKRQLLVLFRVICYFSPKEVTIPEGTPKEIRKVVSMADSRIHITNRPTNFLCFLGPQDDRWSVLSHDTIESEVVIVFIHPSSEMLNITNRLSRGMTFVNADHSMFIIVTRHDLPRQDFEINF